MESSFLRSLQNGYSATGSPPPRPTSTKSSGSPSNNKGKATSMHRVEFTSRRSPGAHSENFLTKVMGSPLSSPNAAARQRHAERYHLQHRTVITTPPNSTAARRYGAAASSSSPLLHPDDVSGMYSAAEKKKNKTRLIVDPRRRLHDSDDDDIEEDLHHLPVEQRSKHNNNDKSDGLLMLTSAPPTQLLEPQRFASRNESPADDTDPQHANNLFRNNKRSATPTHNGDRGDVGASSPLSRSPRERGASL
ncbi:Hypothetical protein, putative [Bodo saltans]|uniref:Uncharacterized protein n=1 Tax=Bodo saltans TaxID=75058 RepID=A0A0S4JDJ6_BODSA|nr:Hypothetical protein, putative [Bodo saltans]|eukprot:CUG88338.1 Hypothetical protein, putative [Bodo saltans]